MKKKLFFAALVFAVLFIPLSFVRALGWKTFLFISVVTFLITYVVAKINGVKEGGISAACQTIFAYVGTAVVGILFAVADLIRDNDIMTSPTIPLAFAGSAALATFLQALLQGHFDAKGQEIAEKRAKLREKEAKMRGKRAKK